MRQLSAWVVLLGVLAGSSAAAQETWAVMEPQVRGVSHTDAATFRDLLRAELGRRVDGGLLAVKGTCEDTVCARSVGQEVGAAKVVYGALSTLGRNIVVTTTLVDTASGSVVAAERLTVDRVEDLESVAARIATALTTGKPIEDTGELGTLTAREERPDRRRHGDPGFLLRIGGLAPFSETHGGLNIGMMLDASFWYEARDFSIEARLGVQFDTTDDDDQSFIKVPFDVSAHYIFGLGDFTPFIGGGLGGRWMREERPVVVHTGALVRTRNQAILDDSGWGFGMLARVGVLLFRTYTVRMTVSVEYDITFVELNDRMFPHALTFGLGVIF